MVDALRQALRGAEEQNTRMQDTPGRWVEMYACEMLKVGGEMCVY